MLGGQLYPDVNSIKPLLNNEKYVLESQEATRPRTRRSSFGPTRTRKTGVVQEVIKVCQEVGFEKFTLRAKSEVGLLMRRIATG